MDIKNLDKKYIANTYNRQDVVFVKGNGSLLYDDNGKEYIDFGCGIAVAGLGQNNEKWVKAITEQAAKLSHISNIYYTEPCVNLAKMLTEKAGMSKVFFCNSGAEANEGAIKCARKYNYNKGIYDRFNIITLKNSFHGRTMATLSATGQDSMHTGYAPLLEGFKYVTPNKIEEILNCDKNSTCAIMIELVQGEGGVIPLDIDYVQNVEKFCKANDILLIIDEVQTGNGRTGTFYTYMQYGIEPDILTTAKGLGNGLPIGAVMFNEKTKDTFSYGDHGSTFGANPICCAGAIATLEQIDNALIDSVKVKSDIIRTALSSCSKVKSISGLGLMLGIECDNAKEVANSCLKKGLVVLTAKNKLRLLPALNISEDILNKGLKILAEELK
jgi:acetylornithine/N-succinyldiaminopimelate aminotransferase